MIEPAKKLRLVIPEGLADGDPKLVSVRQWMREMRCREIRRVSPAAGARFVEGERHPVARRDHEEPRHQDSRAPNLIGLWWMIEPAKKLRLVIPEGLADGDPKLVSVRQWMRGIHCSEIRR